MRRICAVFIFFFFAGILGLGNIALAETPTTVSELMEVLKEEKKEALYNIELNAPFTKASSGVRESISTETGEVLVRNTIFEIPGRGGKNLSLHLEYRSRDARVYEEGTKSSSITNNYGETIIAHYDVFDSNGYWLRTGALKYTTSESTILEEVTIDSETWIFNGYLQYENGTSIISSGSIANYAREKSLVSAGKYIFGEGWSLDIPYLDVDGEDDVYIHLPSGQTYKADFENGIGLKDYELIDTIFTKDTTSGNGVDTSAYKLYHVNGDSYYFSDNGELILEKDRFNNKISYYWEDVDDKRLLTSVVDSLGRVVNIQYNDTVTIFRSGTKEISLIKRPIPGETDKYYLSSFVDAAGRTTGYGYTFDEAAFDLIGGTSANNTYVNLVQITYPTGVRTQYTYEESKKNLGSSGDMEYFKVTERYDINEDKRYNLLKYQYFNEPDGYPQYKASEIDEIYSYHTKVIDSNGLITKYTYNAKHQGYLREQYLDNKPVNQVRTNYHSRYNLPSKMISKTYNENGSISEKISTYEYDPRGNLIARNEPIDSEMLSSNEYKTYYTYDDEYNILTSRKYKQDEDTTVEFRYILSEDKRKVEEESIYSNRNLLSDKIYEYDDYGNITQISIQKESGEWVTNRFEYSREYKGAYLTDVIYEDVIDADGNTKDIKLQYTYDFATGNRLTGTDGNGNITSYTYDALGRITKEILPDNLSRNYQYDDENNILKLIDANGNSLTYYYDNLGNLQKVVEPTKNTILVKLEYDENENLISREDGNKNLKKLTYDGQTRITEVSHWDKKGDILSETQIAYDEAFYDESENPFFKVTVTQKGDTQDNVTNYYFDAFDRLVKLGRIEGGKEDLSYITYDYLGNQTQTKDFAGEKTKYENDGLGRLIKATNAKGSSITYKYDLLGNPISQTDDLGQTAYFKYDRLGRMISDETPFDKKKHSITKLYYDGAGNLVRIVDPEGYTTKQYFTKRNFLHAVEKRSGYDESFITKVQYDGEGNTTKISKGLSSWTDSVYTSTSYKYDELNRPILSTDEKGRKTHYEYDNNGNLIKTLNRNNVLTTYSYDGLNRMIQKENSKDGEKNAIEILYDKLGNPKEISDESGTAAFKYDELNRLISEDYGNGIKKTYSYDKSDRIKRINVNQGSVEELSLKYTYDKVGRLTQVNDNGKKFSYIYDDIGRIKEERNGVTGIKTKYSYYQSGAIKSLIHYDGKEIIDSYEYQYDLRGNQIQKNENNSITKYYYDPLSRLKTVLLPDDGVLDYQYDDLSNIEKLIEIKGNKISETTYRYDIGSRLLLKETKERGKKTQQRFTYDPEGNMLSKEEVFQQDGNITSSSIYNFKYNGYNQLKQTQDPYGRFIDYTYNSNGLRTKKDYGDKAINYYYDRGNIILETDENSSITAKNIRGRRLIYRETTSDIFHYLHNSHGDVTKLVNEQGEIIKDYTYDPFGQEETSPKFSFGNKSFTGIWQREVESIDNPFRYAGEYLDDETGWYYLRARYYDPSIQRFTTEDSYRGRLAEPLSLNLYTYCKNNPIMYIDPSGHISQVDDDVVYSPSTGNVFNNQTGEDIEETGDSGFIDTAIEYGENLISHPVEALQATSGVVLGSIGIVGSGIIEAASAGSATPMVIATAGFSVNTVATSATDLKYIATGEIDKTGSLNPLKSGSKLLFKGAGEGVEYILDSTSTKDYEIGDYAEVAGEYVFEGADLYLSVKGVSQGVQKIADKSYKIYSNTLRTGNMSSVYKNVSNASKVGAGAEIIHAIKGLIDKISESISQ